MSCSLSGAEVSGEVASIDLPAFCLVIALKNNVINEQKEGKFHSSKMSFDQ